MGAKSTFTAVQDAAENLKNVQESQGFDEVKNFAEIVGFKVQTDKALDIKDAASKSFVDKKEIAAETREDAETKPWWRRGLKWAIGGGFALVMGNKIFGGKEETEEITEKVVETTDEVIDIATDEKRLVEVNNSFKTAIEAERDLKEVNKKMNDKWKFKKEKSDKDWFVELEKREKKYQKYGHIDVWKEAWEKTEFEYNKETGKKEKKRNFFWRLLAFVPALTKTYAGWRSFEALKKSGTIDKIKQSKRYKDKAEQKIKEAEDKFEEGMETKREAFSAVFEENPGALQLSKDYFKKLANLTRNADKFSSAERASQLKKITREMAEEGTKKFGPGFSKMKGFEKYMPGISIKSRGGFMVVEIIGKALGRALREGAEGGGLSHALGVFWEELGDANNWKDACPIWGTIRSAQRLSKKDDIPKWSKWLDFGLSAGMDIAMGVGIAASFGTLSAPIIAARGAAGTAVKNGLRKLTLKQVEKQVVKSGEEIITKGLTKKSRRSIAMAAGGRWGVRLNLMMATIGEFFGDDIEDVKTEVKQEAYNTLLTPEQKYFIALEKAAKNGEVPPEREAILAEEDKKRKEEIEHDEVEQEAGILTESSVEDEKEESSTKVEFDSKKSLKAEPKTIISKTKKIVKEEIVSKIAA